MDTGTHGTTEQEGPGMTDDGTSVELDEQTRHHLQVYVWAKGESERYAKMAETARAEVEKILGGREVGTIEGEPAVTWTHSKRTTVDTKALQEALPEVAALYTRTTQVRRFVPKIVPAP